MQRPALRIVATDRPPARTPRPRFEAGIGFRVVYRLGEVNRCPGCGRSNWYIRLSTAECAFCSTALPLVQERK